MEISIFFLWLNIAIVPKFFIFSSETVNTQHKNDIARIIATIDIVDYALPPDINGKMAEFMARYSSVDLDTRALGLGADAEDLKSRLRICFGLE